ncbi:MAG: hypothetical protein OXI16_09220 [Chloroflexota bacterium]|nr:hypothetical protein [Chloroflexota bacterium]
MTTEAPTTNPYSVEERMARMEAQQELLIELLRDNNELLRENNAKIDVLDKKFDTKIDVLDKKFDAKIDALDKKFDAKFDTTNNRIDAVNHRIFLAGIGIFTIVGGGVAAYIVSLLT